MPSIKPLKKEALKALEGVHDAPALDVFRIAYLGRKGKVSLFLRGVAELPIDQRKAAGQAGNELRMILEEMVVEQEKSFGKKEILKHVASIDVSRPGKHIPRGHIHVLSKTLADIRNIFVSMGFSAVEGPEIESEWYNFDALNIPKDHPAREMHDTFWLKTQNTNMHKTQTAVERLLPRTHISGIQVRHMEKHTPPFRIYYEGRAFRHEATDATHGVEFHHIETLYVDKNASVANFKYIVESFLSAFFKKDMQVRLRPAYFPFVEPGFEIDMTCIRCGGKKCTLCTTGWVEIAGAGMVNQAVFRAAGYVPGEWKGIAFAFGVERLAMLKYNIPDLRLFYGGDLRFIEQF